MLKAIKRSSMLLGVFLAFGVSYGMGETTPMQSVPTGITCKVIDNTGKSHILQNCNCDGRTYIDVKDGSLSYFVDLNTVRSIDVEALRANNVEVDLKTNANPNGELVELSKDMICYGLGSLGNAKFYIKNIKSIYILKP
ncbi:hypothetical protein [Hydrogenobaculum sp.]|nr:MAG: hypothetical protein C0170_03065 [Hydrogenobaculum sp.]HEK25503.1 hypothetical protein [Hydrogenobaculum sp.]